MKVKWMAYVMALEAIKHLECDATLIPSILVVVQ